MYKEKKPGWQRYPEILAMALLREKPAIRKILPLGVIHAVIMYGIRLLPLVFGVHSIFSMFVIAILLNLFLKTHFSRSLLSALIVIIALGAAETVFVTLIFSLTNLSYEQYAENMFLYIVGGWPQVILLFFLALTINRWQDKRRNLKEDA
jgi:hypothetical protein